jgi:2-dehydropantoate 2-reductase
MLQDISRAACTEIDAICGAVVRYGRQFGVATPVNQMLLGMVKEKEKGLKVECLPLEQLNVS